MKCISIHSLTITLAGLTLAFTPLVVSAATVTDCGPTVCYEYDTSQDAVGLFGLPTLVGDNLRFTPQAFKAQSMNGDLDFQSANFVIDRVYSTNGLPLDTIGFTEFGDYRIWNDGDVAADLLLTVSDNLGSQFESSLASFEASGHSAGMKLWDLATSIEVFSLFETATNDVAVTLQNSLLAVTQASGQLAFIQKKIAIGATTVVPLPAAVWLLISALASLAWVRRRQQALGNV